MSTILDALRRVEHARTGSGLPIEVDQPTASATSIDPTSAAPAAASDDEIGRLQDQCAALKQELSHTRALLQRAEQLLAAREVVSAQREDKLAHYVEENARLNGRVEALTIICQRRQKQIEAYRDQLRLQSTPEPPVPAQSDVAPQSHGRLGDLLLQTGLLHPEQLEEALCEQAQGPRRPLGAILLRKGLLDEHAVADAIARQLGLPLVHLSPGRFDAASTRLVRRNLAERHLCIPFAVRENELLLAMANPHDIVAIDHVEVSTGRRVRAAVATPTNIMAAIEDAYSRN